MSGQLASSCVIGAKHVSLVAGERSPATPKALVVPACLRISDVMGWSARRSLPRRCIVDIIECMSGPKTSHISLQEQIRMRLAAADGEVGRAIAEAMCLIQRLSDEVASFERTLKAFGASGFAESVSHKAHSELVRAEESLGQLQPTRMSLAALSSIDEIDERSAKLVAQVNAVRAKADKAIRSHANTLREETKRCQRADDAASFARLLEDVVGEAAKADHAAPAAASTKQAEHGGAVTWGDISGIVGDAVVRYANLMGHPEYLGAESANVLVKHGARFLDAVERCAEGAGQQQLKAALGQASQMLELLPMYEGEAAAMREIRAAIAACGTEGVAPKCPAAFLDLDEAQAYFDRLKSAKREALEQAYIRVCIDDVMERHGYDVSRSVRMERSTRGEHLLFGSAAGQDGVHVFVSEGGDMMMEVVGVRNLEDAPDGARVDISRVEDRKDAQNLLEYQNEFCSVYGEIADELVQCGLSFAEVNRCAPGVEFSKEAHIVSDAEGASSGLPMRNAVGGSSRRSRRKGAGNAERAL